MVSIGKHVDVEVETIKVYGNYLHLNVLLIIFIFSFKVYNITVY